ncbi:MAG: VF530 family protein [Epsilonproteobacteria bacterium]|nr:VF530 family protein [Campylobacterota bacterium]
MDNEAKKNSNNPLHGITLEKIITTLYEAYGWEMLALKLNVNCFKKDQSIKSCLTFFRKTPWARAKLETIYIRYTSK